MFCWRSLDVRDKTQGGTNPGTNHLVLSSCTAPPIERECVFHLMFWTRPGGCGDGFRCKVETPSMCDSLSTRIGRMGPSMWTSWWRSSRPAWSVTLLGSRMMIGRPGACGTAPCMMRRATGTGLHPFIARSALWLRSSSGTGHMRRRRSRS